MAISNEMKVMGGVLAVTVLIIVGGAWLAGRDSATAPGAEIFGDDLERLVRPSSPAFAKATAGDASDFADAKVTIAEFGDFQCPACGALHPILKQLKEQNNDKSVRFVYRHFPLAQHEFAQVAAEASVEAQAQGKFWEMHDAMFERQPKLDIPDLVSYAEELGLDGTAMQEALDQSTHRAAVLQDRADGVALGVSSTPTLFLNNRMYTGTRSVEAIQAAIDEVLATP